MNISGMHDAGAYALGNLAQVPYTATAGTTPDATEKNGQVIDRLAANRKLYHSASLHIVYTATLDTLETFSMAVNGQQATDSGFTTGVADMVATRAYKVVADGEKTDLTLTSGAMAATVIGTGGTESGVVVVDFDIGSCPQYIRSQITTDLSRANTDTSLTAGVWVFGGAHELPTE